MKTEDIRKMALALEAMKKSEVDDDDDCNTKSGLAKKRKNTKLDKEIETEFQESIDDVSKASRNKADQARLRAAKRETGIEKAVKKLTKESLVVRYLKKFEESVEKLDEVTISHDRYMNRLNGIAKADDKVREEVKNDPGKSLNSPKEIKEPAKSSATPDQSKLDHKTAPIEVDGKKAIDHNKAAEKKNAVDASKSVAEDHQGKITVDKQNYHWGKMVTVQHGSHNSYPLHPPHQNAIKNLKDGEKTKFKDETGAKVTAHRQGNKVHLNSNRVSHTTTVDHSHFTESVNESLNIETRKPISIRHALQMMQERADEHTAGAYPPEGMADKISGEASDWMDNHPVETPDESNIDAAVFKNHAEVQASLRRTVDYRRGDQKIGDQKILGQK